MTWLSNKLEFLIFFTLCVILQRNYSNFSSFFCKQITLIWSTADPVFIAYCVLESSKWTSNCLLLSISPCSNEPFTDDFCFWFRTIWLRFFDLANISKVYVTLKPAQNCEVVNLLNEREINIHVRTNKIWSFQWSRHCKWICSSVRCKQTLQYALENYHRPMRKFRIFIRICFH